jgi:hypothetical protein
MVPGRSSCSCPTCGVECKGRFAGCAEVWARGPQNELPVQLTHKATGSISSFHGQQQLTNAVSHEVGGGTDMRESPLRQFEFGDSNARLDAVLEEISAVGRLIEQTQLQKSTASLSDEHLAVIQQLAVSIRQLPRAVGDALGDALKGQHRQMMIDVRTLLTEFLVDLRAAETSRADQI